MTLFSFSVKNKFPHAFSNQESPYRISQVLECEFYLLEMMVRFFKSLAVQQIGVRPGFFSQGRKRHAFFFSHFPVNLGM
jgi:hypothetical protein